MTLHSRFSGLRSRSSTHFYFQCGNKKWHWHHHDKAILLYWWWNGENLQAVNPDPSTFLQLTLVGECCKAQCDSLLFNWTCSGIGDQWPLTFLQNTLWSLQICPRTICHLFKWICTMRKKVEKCTAGQSTWTLFSKQCCGDLDKWCFSWFVVRFCLSLQLPVEKFPI